MWPANKLEFIWPVLLKEIRCLCPKDRILVSLGCKFIRAFKCKNSKQRELQITQTYCCPRKSIWRNTHELSHLNDTARSDNTGGRRPVACCCHLHWHETSASTSAQWDPPHSHSYLQRWIQASLRRHSARAYGTKYNQVTRWLDQPVNDFIGVRGMAQWDNVFTVQIWALEFRSPAPQKCWTDTTANL